MLATEVREIRRKNHALKSTVIPIFSVQLVPNSGINIKISVLYEKIYKNP